MQYEISNLKYNKIYIDYIIKIQSLVRRNNHRNKYLKILKEENEKYKKYRYKHFLKEENFDKLYTLQYFFKFQLCYRHNKKYFYDYYPYMKQIIKIQSICKMWIYRNIYLNDLEEYYNEYSNCFEIKRYNNYFDNKVKSNFTNVLNEMRNNTIKQ